MYILLNLFIATTAHEQNEIPYDAV